MREGNAAQRITAALLDDPDRLLSGVLFWNLLVNILYFAVSSIVALRLEAQDRHTEAGVFALGSLLALIFFSEMLPKTLAVLRAQLVAPLVGIPLATAVRVLDPLTPALRAANLLSRRLIWPGFQPEPFLDIGDLERAIKLSTSDAALLKQEQSVLQNIVSLSNFRVDELMRPRLQFRAFRPPISREDLGGEIPPSGYLLVTEPDSDEVIGAVPLKNLVELPAEHLEHLAEQVLYVPWSATAGSLLEAMIRRDREVAAVVNEYGETVGVVTFEDLLDTIFRQYPSRSIRLLQRSSLKTIGPGVWQVTGITSLRRLSKHFQLPLPASRSVTVAGVLQEVLGRFPVKDDQCDWGPFHLQVLESPERGLLAVQLTQIAPPEETP
jgi:CBS domain containing-hemolysin-like protein